MPATPGAPFLFPDDANYPNGSPAKMCIAQVGWTPAFEQPGFIQYWVKVIDQSDSNVKFP